MSYHMFCTGAKLAIIWNALVVVKSIRDCFVNAWAHVDSSSRVFCGIRMRTTSQDGLIRNMGYEITLLKIITISPRGQWVISSPASATYMHCFKKWLIARSTQSLPESMLHYSQLDPKEQTSVKFDSKYRNLHSQISIWKCHLRMGGHFVPDEMS